MKESRNCDCLDRAAESLAECANDGSELLNFPGGAYKYGAAVVHSSNVPGKTFITTDVSQSEFYRAEMSRSETKRTIDRKERNNEIIS